MLNLLILLYPLRTKKATQELPSSSAGVLTVRSLQGIIPPRRARPRSPVVVPWYGIMLQIGEEDLDEL